MSKLQNTNHKLQTIGRKLYLAPREGRGQIKKIQINMKLLISTPYNSQFSVAIGNKQIEKFKIVNKPYRQSELLLKTIEALVGNQENKPSTGSGQGKSKKRGRNINAIFVVQGPGQFSALRIGIATANALSFAWNIPVAGVKLKKEWDELSEVVRIKKIWQEIIQLKLKRTSRFVKPIYGGEPNIG